MNSNTANVGTWHANLYSSPGGKQLVNILTPYGRTITQKMHVATAVSQEAASVLLDKGKDLPINFIPNGIDLIRYKNSSTLKTSDENIILFVGRLEKRKGVKYLIRAYAELCHRYKNIRLVIAGSGSEERRLKEEVDKLGAVRVDFLGYIEDDKKIELMHRARVFCSPAPYGESFGIVLLEAMAADLPIVAGDNPGYQSVMTGMGKISMVNPEDSIDFARRLEVFLFEDSLRKTWLNWSREYVKQFDYEVVVKQYEKAYQDARKIYLDQEKS